MKFQPSITERKEIFEDNPAVSLDAQAIKRHMEDLLTHYYKPITRQWANPVIRFNNLKAELAEHTAMLSSITEISMHPSYQQIIGMGPSAIPLILQEMKAHPGHWFWALRAITGDDPVLPEHRGRIKKMTEDWLNWGKQQLYFM